MTKKFNDYEEFVFVKESGIHGMGLFTSVPIQKGSLIMMIEGEIISSNECVHRENKEGNVYIFWNGDDCFIDTAKTKKIKFINHNCDCNCDVADGDESSLKLIARKNIEANQELTIDYGYEEIYENCKCEKCIDKIAV
ncbi:MAG: SET domain-containing protein-lysine N-methyltransferase [Ignavibacteriaceae bacterium]